MAKSYVLSGSTATISAPIGGVGSNTNNSLPIIEDIRNLTISGPKPIHVFSSSLKANIILVAKYTFHAENENELAIRKGDILKLLDRCGDGWLLVKFVDKLLDPGLIPASYIDIAVNDQSNPITLTWLQSTNDEYSNNSKLIEEYNYIQFQLKNDIHNKPLTVNNKAYPVCASIANFSLFKDRYWYRIDVEYSNQTKTHIGRYYQDFYNLHIILKNLIGNKNVDNEDLNLPKLPEPISVNEDDLDEEKINTLLKRCNALHTYMNKLILNNYFQTSMVLIDWLDLDHDTNELKGFKNDNLIDNLSNDQINEKILPGSVNIVKQYYDKKSLELQAYDESNGDLPKRSKTKNTYNHYQQARNGSINRNNSIGVNRNNSTSINRNNSVNINRNNSVSYNQTNHNPSSTPINVNRNNSTSIDPLSRNNSDSADSTPNTSFNTTAPMPSSNTTVDTSFGSNQSTSSITPTKMPFSPHVPYPTKISPPKLSANSPALPYSPTMQFSPQFSPQYSPQLVYSNMSPQLQPISQAQPYQSNVINYNNNHQFIKCKIVNFNNEIVAIKLNKALIRSINDIKVLVKQKIYFTKLFIKLPNSNNYENIDIVNFSISEFLRFNDKVYLKIS
ncbi:hypothetical protein DFJ63DRAFT_336702 [Scheffersomyces coipomensis]|uniref:uncharacterized protein n=1 Tax=Scheffersomyces coipomensis TaxID=1788519 RepID=UPI00315C9448